MTYTTTTASFLIGLVGFNQENSPPNPVQPKGGWEDGWILVDTCAVHVQSREEVEVDKNPNAPIYTGTKTIFQMVTRVYFYWTWKKE